MEKLNNPEEEVLTISKHNKKRSAIKKKLRREKAKDRANNEKLARERENKQK